MLIISQNLTNYDIQIPKDAIFRVNLAWCDSINQLNNILKKHQNTPIFLDLPIKRIKPPNNRYAIEDLISVINSNEHIRYLAISNVESDTDLKKYVELLPKNLGFRRQGYSTKYPDSSVYQTDLRQVGPPSHRMGHGPPASNR